LRDLWWTFTMIGDGQESPLTPAKIFPKQGSTMFTLRPEEIARFKQANLGFAAAVKPGCERSESAIRDKDGGKVIVVGPTAAGGPMPLDRGQGWKARPVPDN
jgi:hypothetical protein